MNGWAKRESQRFTYDLAQSFLLLHLALLLTADGFCSGRECLHDRIIKKETLPFAQFLLGPPAHTLRSFPL